MEKLITSFPDGTEVVAVPAVDDDALGALHDAVHSLVAQAMDLPASPTLWRLAHGDDPAFASNSLVAYEEAAVLAITEYVRALNRVL